MANNQIVPWKRIGVEAVAIVASILLAFAIDAWWENRQENTSDTSHLTAVANELRRQRELLDESIAAHQETIDAGEEVLNFIASKGADKPEDEVLIALRRLVSFYQINAPFGALETAMLAGAIPRMTNSELATSLASWPTAIEDLKEEQDQGFRIMFALLDRLTDRMPMAAVYAEKLRSPTIRGTSEIVQDQTFRLGSSPFDFRPDSLYEDHAVESQILILLVLAQAARAEATVFADTLDQLIAQLDACLQQSNC
ncbi:MAG: hypothetical protein AAGC71_16910 [Pseudomonadota bacterium]